MFYDVDPKKIAKDIKIPIQGGMDPKFLLGDRETLKKEAKKYLDNGFSVIIENDLASHLGISDEDFRKAGCQVDNRENVLKKSLSKN